MTPAEIVDLVFPELYPEWGEFYMKCGWVAPPGSECNPQPYGHYYPHHVPILDEDYDPREWY